jgi:hypothetical protein
MKDLGLDYTTAMHGVQSAIKFKIENGWDGASPKHLRVGVDGSKSDMLGLVELLISKGLFTAEEYIEHMRLAANQELAIHEEQIAKLYPNIKVSFR